MRRIVVLLCITLFLAAACSHEEKLGAKLENGNEVAKEAAAGKDSPQAQEAHPKANGEAREKERLTTATGQAPAEVGQTKPETGISPPFTPSASKKAEPIEPLDGSYLGSARKKTAPPKKAARKPAAEADGHEELLTTSPRAASNGGDVEDLAGRIDAYLGSLKTAAYTFNPPSPITVAKAVTLHLWLDPIATPEQLAEELKKLVPEDASRVEAGETLWAPLMEASLKGDNFNIAAVTPERQPVSSKVRTIWSWSITPKQPGEKQPLYLTINVVLPEELGGPKTIKTFERKIDVDVTWWWLFDFYFEKYWKWLLGGLGTALASAIGWWWKKKHGAKDKE